MTPDMTSTRHARVRRAVAATIVLASAGYGAPAAAAAAPDFHLPFSCGQQWYGSTRSGHSPSYWSVDFNRDGDLGTPVVASTGGVVTSVVDLGDRSYGRYVVVEHESGWSTLYAHLLDTIVVEGQRLDEGQVIGRLGDSGGSTGPHLHYEQRLNRIDQRAVFNGTPFDYGTWITSRTCVDVPLAGDWNGNGRADLGLYRRGSRGGVFVERMPGGARHRTRLGSGVEMPVVGDWTGRGADQPGVYLQRRRLFRLQRANGSVRRIKMGIRGSMPVAADWNGDGSTDVGIWNPATHRFRLRLPGGRIVKRRLGRAGYLPVAGDWDDNGRGDVGVYDPATSRFTLRLGSGRLVRRTVGTPGSLPVAADFNGDGRTDLGTWNPHTARYDLSVRPLDGVRFGRVRGNVRARAAEASLSREPAQHVRVVHTD